MRLFGNKKGEAELNFGLSAIVAVVAGIIIIVGIIYLRNNWTSAINFLRNIMRFGG